MPDSTEKLDAARKLVGTYWRTSPETVQYAIRIIGMNESCFRCFTLSKSDDGANCMIVSIPISNNGTPAELVRIPRAEYLAVAGPLFTELGRMAGVTEECERKE